MPEETALLPMFALILVRKLRPMTIGSLSGWLMLQGRMARPRAISSRTNSGVTYAGIDAPKDCPGCCRGGVRPACPGTSAPVSRSCCRIRSRRWFSRIATNSISGVTIPRRA